MLDRKKVRKSIAEAEDREEAYQIANKHFAELEEQYRKAHQRFIEFHGGNYWLKNRIERIQGIQTSDEPDTVEFDEISTLTISGSKGSGKTHRANRAIELEGGDAE